MQQCRCVQVEFSFLPSLFSDLLEREVTNFDVDLMDCTVLACAMAAYCPYLVRKGRGYLSRDVYQILHTSMNSL